MTAAAPTFELLRARRRLAVVNPRSGACFTISLRDWEEVLWAVRVHPASGWRRRDDPCTRAHLLMRREVIENWLEDLRLPAPGVQRGRPPSKRTPKPAQDRDLAPSVEMP